VLGRKKKKEPSILLGKVLRIDRDGTIPEDNPFPDSPVYTLGHRNIYGIAFDPKSGLGLSGWKVVMYNLENNTAVKMESYIDDENNNTWIKVNDFIDRGGWFVSTSDDDFDDVNCGLPKDYIVTNSGPVASFRSDGIVGILKI
jgi:hypothetical protein